MPKRKNARKKRASSSNIITALLLILLAGFAGWFLLRPLHHPPRRSHLPPVAVATETPLPQTPVPESTATPTVAATRTPEVPSTATPAPTASAQASLPPVPPRVGNPNAPKLALIIDDCGQWVSVERRFIALPIPITLSVLPHVHASKMIAQEAADAGKGVMLHLPMETVSGLDPGPGRITTEMTDAQIAAQVNDDLAQVPLAQGVNNHEGSKASADRRVMSDVVDVLQKHGGLFFVDSRTSAASVAQAVASAAGMPSASRDVFLDNKDEVAYTEGQLREAAAIAKRTGSAIAIGHPRATTLAAIKAMIPQFESAGIQFVLARDLAH